MVGEGAEGGSGEETRLYEGFIAGLGTDNCSFISN